MTYYAALDVSLRSVAVCIIDDQRVLCRTQTLTCQYRTALFLLRIRAAARTISARRPRGEPEFASIGELHGAELSTA